MSADLRSDPRFGQGPVSLSFEDPAMERAWRAEQAHESRAQARFGVALLALLFSAFVVNDAVLFRGHLPALVAIRFGVVLPVLLVALWIASAERWTRWLERWFQEYLLVVDVVVCVGMLAMSWVLSSDASPLRVTYGGLAFLVCLMGVYSFSLLRFVYAVPVGLGTTLAALTLLPRVPVTPAYGVALAVFAVVMNGSGAWTTRTLEVLARREFVQRQLLREARARSEALLRNALPAGVAERLRDGAAANIADRHDEVTVVLADLVGFTALCERLPPDAIAQLLDGLYTRFDTLCEAHGVEKIKTLGDGWLAAAGVPASRPDHALAAARLALAMRAAAAEQGTALRIGVHTGPAVAGVIGRTRFAYDLWGDAVAGATVMERTSVSGGIRVSPTTAALLPVGMVREGDGYWLA
jgi:class 3 adenylate cyclase